MIDIGNFWDLDIQVLDKFRNLGGVVFSSLDRSSLGSSNRRSIVLKKPTWRKNKIDRDTRHCLRNIIHLDRGTHVYKSLYIKFAHVRPTNTYARTCVTKKEFLKRMECRVTHGRKNNISFRTVRMNKTRVLKLLRIKYKIKRK